jgi:hypothetical protein
MDFEHSFELVAAVEKAAEGLEKIEKVADSLEKIEKRLAGIEAALKEFGSSYDVANQITGVASNAVRPRPDALTPRGGAHRLFSKGPSIRGTVAKHALMGEEMYVTSNDAVATIRLRRLASAPPALWRTSRRGCGG